MTYLDNQKRKKAGSFLCIGKRSKIIIVISEPIFG